MIIDTESGLFRKSALSRLSSVDDLDSFLRIANPNAWVGIVAILAIFAGLLVWAFFAEVPVRATGKALVEGDRHATCWVDADMAERLRSPDVRVSIAGAEASGVEVDSRPVSGGEVRERMGGGYLADELDLGEWNFRVELLFPEVLYGIDVERPFLAPVEVIYNYEHPIALVFGA